MDQRVSPSRAASSRFWPALAGIALFGVAPAADARVTTLTITNTQTAFSGATFGSVGAYEAITGTFIDEVDPDDPHNAVIADIDRGPKNSNGTVSFSGDFQIIKPKSLVNSAHRVMYDLPNRGNAGALGTLNGSSPVNTAGNAAMGVLPSSGAAGNGFLMKMGWTIVEVGWDISAPQTGNGFKISPPVAKHHDGSSITGPALEELVVDFTATAASLPLTYPAASADKSKASLTVRENYGDTPQLVSSSCWGYTDTSLTAVKLTTGNFGQRLPLAALGLPRSMNSARSPRTP
jgi:hypothetical protein